MVTMRSMIALPASKGWNISQMDVYNAFLQGICTRKCVWNFLKVLGDRERQSHEIQRRDSIESEEITCSDLGLSGAKPVSTPIDLNQKFTSSEFDRHTGTTGDEILTGVSEYQRLIGRLIYFTITRPDIVFAMQTLNQFMQEPKNSHWDAAMRIGQVVQTHEGLFAELGVPIKKHVEVCRDSKAALQIAANHIFHEHTKHIEIDCHFVCAKIKQGVLSTQFVGTKDRLADLLTKGLGQFQHAFLLGKL
ncbi:PREDICTED: uncharacterized protein LOC109210291 [Nicotiana attenuata]|uniref:uncharacterized protein LOC109210291 n=1 Tax=Nicotiana attenuata TaxID=49451 RepID=UPI0009051842|nr:PREDICTED: uncharacterized protein LOC109210291 [Nicotiana attenuata]